MIVDQTKTGRLNIIAMVKPIAKLKNYKDADLQIGTPQVITPAAANGFTNTRIPVTGTVPSKVRGQALVTYNRLTLPTARPTAGTKMSITNADTHATLLNKIITQHRMVADQVVLTTQTRLPLGRGEVLDFKVDPIPNSVIYAPGTLTIKVRNDDLFIAQDPSMFFGTPSGTRNDLPVFTMPRIAFKNYTRSLSPSMLNFFNMLNYHQVLKFLEIMQKDVTLGPLEIANTNQNIANTYVKVSPRDNSVFATPFYIFYSRFNFSANRNMRNAGPQYQAPVSLEYLDLICEYEGIPRDAVTFVSMSQTATSRTVIVSWNNNNFIGYGTNQQTSFRYYW